MSVKNITIFDLSTLTRYNPIVTNVEVIMKYFVSNIIPRILSFSKKIDKISVICDRKWRMIDDEDVETSYIFRAKNELLVAKSGVVSKGKWDIINNNDIMLEIEDSTLLFRQAFIDENIFVLNLSDSNLNRSILT
jgi:hypothetical protein